MKLIMYGLKDNITGEFVFFFQSQNEGTMKRVVNSALLGREPNIFTRDLKDKDIYELGEIETSTGVIKAIQPLFVVRVAEIRLELIKQIKIAKQEEGVANPTAEEVASDEQ